MRTRLVATAGALLALALLSAVPAWPQPAQPDQSPLLPVLPVAFDLRDQDGVTPVKQQLGGTSGRTAPWPPSKVT
jgi:hypothetical protein